MHVIVQREQESFVKLERQRELLHQLPRGIQQLSENRRYLFAVALYVTATFCEFVPERQPVFLDQCLHPNDVIEMIKVIYYQRTNRRQAQSLIRDLILSLSSFRSLITPHLKTRYRPIIRIQ